MNTNSRFSVLLLRILKIFGIATGALFLLFMVFVWIVFIKKNDWLQEQIQLYLKESQSGQLVIGELDLKLLRNFPDVTIELSDIKYFEHIDSIRTADERPILSSKHLYVAFELMPLLKNELKITAVNLSGALINVVEYPDGKLNIANALKPPAKKIVRSPVTTKSPNKRNATTTEKPKKIIPKATIPPRSPLQIELKNVEISDLQLSWKSKSGIKADSIFVKNIEAKVNMADKIMIASISSQCNIQNVNINLIHLPESGLSLKSEIYFDTEKKNLNIKSCEILYDEIIANISGSYTLLQNQKLNMSIDAYSKDLRILSVIMKPGVISQNTDLLKKGSLYIKGRIYGELKNNAPQIDINFGMKDLDLRLPGKIGRFTGIGFEGKYFSKGFKDLTQAQLEIQNLKGLVPGGFIKGNFKMNNFIDPFLNYNLSARLNLLGFDQVFKLNGLHDLKGFVSVQANFNGKLKQLATHRMDKRRSSVISLKDVSFKLIKSNQYVKNLSGKLETENNQTTLDNINFKYGEDDFHVNAIIKNLMFMIFKNEKGIDITGNLFSKQIYTKDFILDTSGSAQVKDRLSDLSFDFKFVSDTMKNADSTQYINFDIRNLKVKLDKLSDINNLEMNGRVGKTSGGLKLDLYKLSALMPHGKIDVDGDMLIPEKRKIEFNARLRMEKFPWTYVKDLIDEMDSDKEPSAKNLPVDSMKIITADLDLSSTIISYPFDINKLIVRKSRARIKLPGSKIISADEIILTFDKFYFIHPKNSGSIAGVKSAEGTVTIKELKIPEMNSFDIQTSVKGEDDQLNFIFTRVAKMSKKEKGYFSLDISKKEPAYKLRYDVQGADLGYFINKLKKGKIMSGQIDYTLDLKADGSDWTKIKHNISGTITIKGNSLLLSGIDIDNLISKFKQSQNFNLTDVGAVLIAGPVGLAVTKGQDFVSLARINFDSTSSTRINVFYSKWRLEKRQLISEDVAITTKLNRIAFNGRIDFANDSIPGINIAVVDKNGCSLMHQDLYGKMNALKTGKLNITKTIFGSVINSVNSVVGKDCVPVYNGVVKNPVQ